MPNGRRPRPPQIQRLQTPDGLLRWDSRADGPVEGFTLRAVLNGRAISDESARMWMLAMSTATGDE